MRKLYLLCILLLAGMLFAQTAEIKIEAMSPHELEEEGITVERSSGLHVVGVNEIVFLVGKEANDSTVTTYSWSIASAPTGSAAVLDSTDTWRTTFRPDVEGQFDISLTITTAQGSDDTTITIYSAKYVGVGTIGGATPSIPQCGACHSDKVTEWEATGHATMFTEAIDGLKSDHYASYCIGCHTVGYNENADGNDGFDDMAAQEGFVFPSPLDAGNWDSLLTANPLTMAKANIQCENCHGPGSLHNGDKAKIAISLDEGVCGQCHEEPPYHRRNIQWKVSGHGVGPNVARFGGRAPCQNCHSGDGYLNTIKQDPEYTPQYAKISCQVCHDPHDATNLHQLRGMDPVTLIDGKTVYDRGTSNQCVNCHKSRRWGQEEVDSLNYSSHFGPHYGAQSDVFLGANGYTFGKTIASSSPHNQSIQNACVDCHMAATPATPEEGQDLVGDHTFAVSYVQDSVEYHNVNACNTCHSEITTSFEQKMAWQDYDEDGEIEPFIHEVDGLMKEISLLLPPYGEDNIDSTLSLRNLTQLELGALWNYRLIYQDHSHGIHNPTFTINLLKVTLDTLRKVTGIEFDPTNIPEEYVLEQNYPNPFNPTTRIKFGLPQRSEVTLVVYNMLGQVVKTLVQGQLEAGFHTYTWDGRDQNGNVVASGTYIYTLRTDQGIISKKMVFIK